MAWCMGGVRSGYQLAFDDNYLQHALLLKPVQVSVLAIYTMPTTAFAAAPPEQRVPAKSVKSED